MKTILIGLIKKPFMTILLVIQLVICCSLIVDVIVERDLDAVEKSVFEETVRFDSPNTYSLLFTEDRNSSIYLDKVKYFEKCLMEDPQFQYGTFTATEAFFINHTFQSAWNEIALINGMRTESIQTDSFVYENMNIEVSEGRTLNENDFVSTTSPKPVLVGSDLRDIAPVGTELTLRIAENQIPCVVAGILKENSRWISKVDPISDVPILLDSRMVIPYDDIMRNYTDLDIRIRISNPYLGSLYTENETFTMLSEIARNSEIQVVTSNLYRMQQQRSADVAVVTQYKTFLSIFMSLIAGIGIVCGELANLRERKTEIGVRLSAGFSKRDMILVTTGEVLVLQLLSTFLGTTILIRRKLQSDAMLDITEFYLRIFSDPTFYLKILSVVIIITVLTALPIALTIQKKNIIDLIRKEE